ncbi:MAG TPA: rhomboid family intramembrane serine protease [bacterium]|nr:rhomboid family intramembrane serine protease [bacterium]
MIPLRDLNPTKRTPVVTYGLVALNVLVFVYQLIDPSDGLRFACVPRQIIRIPLDRSLWPLFTMITSAFLHGGVLHLLFNMWFLWIFGDNVEDKLGPVRFLGFYLMGAVAAAAAHIIVSLGSPIPMIGASGAISAVLGAYLFYFPKAKIKSLVIFFIVPLPAWLFLGIWFGTQILSTLSTEQGVAWFAHIGGFLYGFLISLRDKKNKI